MRSKQNVPMCTTKVSKYGKRAYGILFEVQSSDTLFVQLYDVIYICFANQNIFGNVED